MNGVDGVFFIDTGAASVELTTGFARRLRIDMHAAGQGTFAGGKTAQVRAGRIDTLAFPGVTVRGVPAGEIPGAVPMGSQEVDGAIGTVLLRQFVATIDYVHGKLILRPPSSSRAIEEAAAKSGAAVVPMWLVGDHFIFARARVNDAPEGLFSVDTGGGPDLGVDLSKESLEAAHITPDAANGREVMGAGGPTRVEPFTAASVALGSLVQTNVPGAYFADGDVHKIFPFDVAGAISHAFFRSTEVTFDFDAMNMIVQKV